MYKISVPVKTSNILRNNREETLRQIKRLNAERVFLSLGCYELNEEKKRIALAELKDNCAFFKAQGFEVGAWIWAFWVKGNTAFRNMRSIMGSEIAEFMCPTDEKFVGFACQYAKDVAACGVDIIMFDDDFRYGFLSDSPACLCDGHIRLINGITRENSTREEIYGHIISGSKNKYRDAYLKANGDALRGFASALRSAVDEVDPEIRMGACACMSSWDIDGTNARELADILAGNTRPFVRLIGAPCWAVNKAWGNSLQDVVELERMESSWTKDKDIEIMAEGDAYPRPRTLCPASYIEGFDMAIRASGCTDGILKYGIDYHSNANYETGYAQFHERNKVVYSEIDAAFKEKTPIGVRVYEYMNKISDMVMPTRVNSKVDIQDLFFSKAARMLSYHSIPTVYEGEGICGIVFDENARHLPLDALKNGLILDVQAAEILTDRGIDVGIEHIGDAVQGGVCERFLSDGNHILTQGITVCDLKLSPHATVLSDTESANGVMPVSYRYENADGHRFLVLNLNTRSDSDNILKHYARSKQLADHIPWLSGEKLPAYVYGSPALYMQCKGDEASLSVGLWNFFADVVIEPIIELSKKYKTIRFINCNGRLEGDKVYLNTIPAFGFVGFSLK